MEETVVSNFGKPILNAETLQRLVGVAPDIMWLASIPNPNTRNTYRRAVEHFLEFLRIKSPGQLREVGQRQFVAWRKAREAGGYAAREVAARITGISSFFNFLRLHGLVTYSPPSKVPRKTAKLEPFTMGQLQVLQKAIWKCKRDRAIVGVLHHRVTGDIMPTLRVSDYSDKEGTKVLRILKNGNEHHIKLSSQVAEALDDYLKLSPHITDIDAPLFIQSIECATKTTFDDLCEIIIGYQGPGLWKIASGIRNGNKFSISWIKL